MNERKLSKPITPNGRVRTEYIYINGIFFTFLFILPIILFFRTQLITDELFMILMRINLFIQPIFFILNIWFFIQVNKYNKLILIFENIMILGFFIMIALLNGLKHPGLQ